MNCIARTRDFGKGTVTEFSETSQEEWPAKWPHKEMFYDVIGTCRSLTDKQVKKALNFAMTTWDIEIDVSFHPTWYYTDKKPHITIDFKTSSQEKMFKDSPSVLAYAYFPGQGEVSGKVVFNDDYIWSMNGKPIRADQAPPELVKGTPLPDVQLRTYNIIHVLIHELGHSLGLRHDSHGDTKDVMDPYYSGQLELSDWDLYRIRLKYPARQYAKWDWYRRLKNALRLAKARL